MPIIHKTIKQHTTYIVQVLAIAVAIHGKIIAF